MPKAINESVVVITGASSGIGRATALEFAGKGATVVVAARRQDALDTLVDECQQLGADALAVPTDVTDQEAVESLARTTVERYGRLDTWVNNAAVTLFARFEEAPPESYRRVIETNIFGYIHGARAAMRYFREQGQGVLINTDSVVGAAPQPYTSAYVLTKFAIRGFTDSLRMELSLEQDHDIHVCMVMPASIDTPLFQHAANYTGRGIKALNPVYPAEEVARTIVGLAENPRRAAVAGGAGRLMMQQYKLAPGLYERMAARQIDADHFLDQPAPPSDGNLFEPMPEHTGVSGGWRHPGEVSLRRLALAGVAAVPALLSWFWLRPRMQRNRRRQRGIQRLIQPATRALRRPVSR